MPVPQLFQLMHPCLTVFFEEACKDSRMPSSIHTVLHHVMQRLWHVQCSLSSASICLYLAGGGVPEWHGAAACTTVEAAQCFDSAQSASDSSVYVRAASSSKGVHCQVQHSRAAQTACCSQQSSCTGSQASPKPTGCISAECCVLDSIVSCSWCPF